MIAAALGRNFAAFALALSIPGSGLAQTEAAAIQPDDNPAAADVIEPPLFWTSWRVSGTIVEPLETVRSFLNPRIEAHRPLTADGKKEIGEFCRDIGYELIDVRRERAADGSAEAVFVLEPVLLVYYVDIKVDNWEWSWPPWISLRAYAESIFENEIRRRLQLRAGVRLKRDPEALKQQIHGEEKRLREFLFTEGFYDAKISFRWRPHGPHSVRLLLKVDKGIRYRTGRVVIEGNTAIPAREIEAKFRHSYICPLFVCFGEAGFSKSQLHKDAKAVEDLYHKRGYPGVRVQTDFNIQRGKKVVDIYVSITERRKIDIAFEGNNQKAFPDTELKSVLTFSEEGSYDEVEIQASAEALRRHYQSKGYFEASVAWERERFSPHFERVVFSIDEGPKLAVAEVSFAGNRAISSDTLRGTVSTRVFRQVTVLGGGGFVTSLQLEQDKARIRQLYRQRGFYDVAVASWVSRDRRVGANAAALAAAVAGDLEAHGLYVSFLIDEGPRYTVTDVEFEFQSDSPCLLDGRGPELDPENLRHVIALRSGEAYHEERAKADGDRLRRHYFERGYPLANVTTKTHRNGAHVQIVHEICENPPAQFGKVLVRGNFRTQDWVIEDELGFREGSPVTLRAAERGRRNLQTTGLFKDFRVTLLDVNPEAREAVRLPHGEEIKTVNVVVNVQELESRAVEGALGYSTDFGPFFEGILRRANLWGSGLRADGRLQWGDQFKFAELKLAAPRWIARRLTWGGLSFNSEAAGFYRSETTPRFGDLDSYGASVAFTKAGIHDFFEGWLLSFRYDFRQRRRDVPLVRGAGPNDDLTRMPLTTRTGAIGPQLIIDKRRDERGVRYPLAPQKGFKLEFRALLADPALGSGAFRFVKLGFGAQHFWKASDRLLITNGVRYDHGVPLDGEVLLPEVERFFAGGDTTVRGYEEDRLGTEIVSDSLPPLGEVSQLRVLPAGGNLRFVQNLDLQLRVWDISGVPVASALFLDTGLVTNSLYGTQITDLRHGLGAALFRLAAPFGNVSLEYAIPLDPQLGDNPRGRFHLNIGLLF